MAYDTCLKLKQAGFPQEGSGEHKYFRPDGTEDRTEFGYNHERIYIPTLSELIAECGDDFRSLSKIMKDEWQAVGPWNKDETYRLICNFNKTPQEAVSNLYLALRSGAWFTCDGCGKRVLL